MEQLDRIEKKIDLIIKVLRVGLNNFNPKSIMLLQELEQELAELRKES